MALSGNLSGKKKSMSEINVTPLVDVMLVLLVIFMVTAPLMLSGIKLDLPKTKEVNPLNLTKKQVVLSYTLGEEYFLGKEKFLKKELVERINHLFSTNKSDILYLRADKDMKYGKVTDHQGFAEQFPKCSQIHAKKGRMTAVYGFRQ